MRPGVSDLAELRAVAEAALEVWHGRYRPTNGRERSRQWVALKEALVTAGYDANPPGVAVCPNCGVAFKLPGRKVVREP